jgi:hypothetical protein
VDGRQILVSCFDPEGRAVLAVRGRWERHVRVEHPEVAEHDDAVRQTIERPDLIHSDKQWASREHFYRRGVLPGRRGGLFLKVCVEFGAPHYLGWESIGLVVTAYPLARPKRGEVVKWRP